jgi:hypothetical protein
MPHSAPLFFDAATLHKDMTARTAAPDRYHIAIMQPTLWMRIHTRTPVMLPE